MQRLGNFLTILSQYSLGQKLGIMGNIARYYVYKSILRREYLLKRVHGNKMYLSIQRPGISRALAFFGTREELETKVFKQTVKEGMVMVDLGANIGYYTLIAASIVGSKGRIYAIEPFPESLELLAKNIQVNGFAPIVELHQLAISDRSGTLELFIGKADNLHSLLQSTDNQSSLTVQTLTLDRFLADKTSIDFLRMDIEGAECLVFDGMDRTLNQSIPPRILFEIHPTGDIDPDPKFTPRLEKLISRGYRPKYIVSSSNPISLGRFAELGYKPEEIARSGNALFEDIRVEDLMKVAARRPKITRAILLVHQTDAR